MYVAKYGIYVRVLYLLKRTTENVEETNGRVFKQCKHLENETSARTQQTQCSDCLGVMQCGDLRFLFTRVIGTVNTTISRHLTHVTHRQCRAMKHLLHQEHDRL